MTRFVSFDLEIAKILPKETSDLLSHRPLGITCAATCDSDEDKPRLWYSRNSDGTPAAQMDSVESSRLVEYLKGLMNTGATVVTWNGLKFDFIVLADATGLLSDCQWLARQHVDMMFQFYCHKGFFVSLAKVAQGMGVSPKSTSVDGALAPQLWADGKCQEILDYVSQDAITTLEVAQAGEHKRRLDWITGRGSLSSAHLDRGWQSVVEAMELPLPDTSWMSDPVPRSVFLDWLAGS